MWRPTWKGLLAHKLRLALTALAVVLGIAFVSGTFVFTDTIDRVFEDLFGEATAGVDVEVRAVGAFESSMGPDREPLPEHWIDTVRAMPGVATAAGAVEGYAQLVDPEGEAIAPTAPTLGVSWAPPPLTPLSIRAGRAPERGGEIAVDAATAAEHGFSPGDRTTVLTLRGPVEAEIVGVVGFGAADNLAGATLTVFSLPEAQRVLGLDGVVTSVRVAAEEGTSPEQVAARLNGLLPDDLEAVEAATVASEQAAAIGDALGFLRTGLLVFAAVALFVGSFLIANTFSIVVAQRTREFALLRALGASGRQVTLAVLGEAALVGVVASLVGVGLGALVAKGLQSLLRAFGLDLPGGALVLAPRTVVVGVAVGTVVTLLAALLPARRAARIAPIAALRAADAPPRELPRRRVVAGAGVTALGALLMGVALAGLVPQAPAVTGVGVLAVFVGVALLTPLAARPFADIAGAPVARTGVPGRLARNNARANPRRTAATASALMIGLALVGFVATFAESLRQSALAAIEDEVRADLVLRGPQAQIGMGFSPVVAERLRERPEIGVVSPMRIGFWRDRVDAGNAMLYAIDPATVDDVLRLDAVAGDLADLGRDGVAIERSVAEGRGLQVGDTLPMTFARTGREDLRVVAVLEPSGLLDAGYVISLEAHEERFQTSLDLQLLARAAEGVPVARAHAAASEVAEAFPGTEVFDQAEFRERQREQINQLLGLVTALLLLAVGIALLGITNTLALSVFERTREIGLVRAVGMSRRQVRSMIRWEALLVALLGAVVGVAMGALFGWAVVRALGDEGITHLAIPVGQLGLAVVVAGVAGVLAGVLPARRAARLDILASLAHD